MYGTACRLRVLNAVRDPQVGLPLTATQLEALSLPVVVARCAANGVSRGGGGEGKGVVWALPAWLGNAGMQLSSVAITPHLPHCNQG